MDKKRFQLNKDSEWWVVQDNTIQVNEYGYRDDLTGEDKYRGLKQDLTEQETVDLLNELFDENGKLKEETSYLFQELNQRIVKNNKLRKQIQEQKDKINQLEKELKEKEKENEYIMELREDFNLDKYIEMRKLLEKYQQDELERNLRF